MLDDMVTRAECAILGVLTMLLCLLRLFLFHLKLCDQANQVMFRLCTSTKQHFSRRLSDVFADKPHGIASNTFAMVPVACMLCV